MSAHTLHAKFATARKSLSSALIERDEGTRNSYPARRARDSDLR